ncbi:hypothetical protein D9M72_327420 [compost metagenome]
MDDGRPFHLPRPARLPAGGAGRALFPARHAGLGRGHPAREPARTGRAGPDAAARRGHRHHRRPLADLCHQGQLARQRAPAGLSRLYRCQAAGCTGPAVRRAPLRGPVHLDRLHGADRRDPAGAAQVRQYPGARRLPHQGTPVQVAGHHPRAIPARRTVPGERGRTVRHHHRHPAVAGTPAHAAVRAARPFRPLCLVPGVRAARQVQHRPAPEDPEAADRGLPRHQLRIHAAAVGIAAGAHPADRARRAGHDAACRYRRAGAAHRPRQPPLAGRPCRSAAREPRRGTRQPAAAALRRLVPRGLPRRLPRADRRARHRADGARAARQRQRARHGHEPVPADRGGARRIPLQGLPRRRTHRAVAQPAHARTPGRARGRRAPLPDRARQRRAGVGA